MVQVKHVHAWHRAVGIDEVGVESGDVPGHLREKLAIPETSIPQALQDAVSQAREDLTTYPFTRPALEEFIDSCAQAELSNKPREVLHRLQRAATKAIRKGDRLIDQNTVEEIVKESGV